MKHIIKCPICSRKLRIPLKFQRIRVSCPICLTQFEYEFKLTKTIENILKTIKNIILPSSSRKFENFNYGYTNLSSADKIKKIFIIWCAILILLFFSVIFLKRINDNKRKVYHIDYPIKETNKQDI